MFKERKMARGMRSFIVIWLGQLLSLLGSGLTNFAMGVWIYEQTGQATPFAITALLSVLPSIILSPFAGALVDRWNRRRVMIVSDVLAAAVTLVAFLLLAAGQLQVWNIYVLSFVGAIMGAFQRPAYTASITMLVPKKDLARASGLVDTGQAITQLVSPIVAGFLVVSIGLKGVMFIDFVTCFFAIFALFIIHIPQPEISEEGAASKGSLFSEAISGWQYIVSRAGLFHMLIYFSGANFLLSISGVLTVPLTLSFADADVMGILQSAGGAGMLVGSLLVSVWGGTKRRIYTTFATISLAGVGVALMGLRPNPWVLAAGSILLMFMVPFARASSQAIWQTKVPPDMQGRVFASRGMISMALMPVAYVTAGPLADGVFEPFLNGGSALAESVGRLIGTGAGRGFGLMFVVAGLLQIVISFIAFLDPRLRRVELEIPDAVPDVPGEGAPVGEAELATSPA